MQRDTKPRAKVCLYLIHSAGVLSWMWMLSARAWIWVSAQARSGLEAFTSAVSSRARGARAPSPNESRHIVSERD
jgi:hypothetical protein